jgi:hypothetical protein
MRYACIIAALMSAPMVETKGLQGAESSTPAYAPYVLCWPQKPGDPRPRQSVGLLYTPELLAALIAAHSPETVPARVSEAVQQQTPIVVIGPYRPSQTSSLGRGRSPRRSSRTATRLAADCVSSRSGPCKTPTSCANSTGEFHFRRSGSWPPSHAQRSSLGGWSPSTCVYPQNPDNFEACRDSALSNGTVLRQKRQLKRLHVNADGKDWSTSRT